MSVAPHAGIVDFGTFTPPTSTKDGIQGEVPQPLQGEQDYVLTASGWVALSSLGTLVYQGTWDASTNTPTLVSSVGTQGYYYVVSVAGNTDLNGITTWTVGDWALFNGSVWQKIEGGSTVDITGGQINNTLIGNLVPAAGTFTTLTATGQTSLGGAAGSESLRVYTPSATGTWLSVKSTAAVANIGVEGTSLPLVVNTNSGIFSVRASSFGGVSEEQFRVTRTNSAVNYVQVTGSATLTGGPTISAQGSDFNIPLRLSSKGISAVELGNPAGWAGLTVTTTNNPNRIALNAPATGFIPTFSTAGVDTNAGMAFISKGTGAIDLAAGSSGVNISNGGTVTAITVTASGSNYTSIPSCAITAPTTAGGVQATATPVMFSGAATIAGGGTGYAVNDVLTVTGGTYTTQATYTVTAVSGGVITSVSRTTGAGYSVLPSNPVSVTGGTGTGATLNLTWTVGTPTITNAGSGYVEQPTVTFSGGGGSGAAAYATVGGTATIKGLYGGGSQIPLQFAGPAGNILQLMESGTTSSPTALVIKTGGSSAQMYPSLTNSDVVFSASGTGALRFYTGTLVSQQLVVTNTASAVNYVQVTGAATGSGPTISAQGSDTNAFLAITSKGTSAIRLQTGGTSQVFINHTASAVNTLNFSGGAAGSAPYIASLGTDTNIDLALTTKGTGTIQMNSGAGVAFQVSSQATNVNYGRFTSTAAGTSPLLQVIGSDTNVDFRFRTQGTGAYQFDTGSNANTQLKVANTASAVNYVQVTGAATGGTPTISTQGSDANVNLNLQSKGTGYLNVLNNRTNYFQFYGGNTGQAPTMYAWGSDTNIDLTLTPKGTGNVRFGTYTGTALSIAGYIEIKDAGGTVRKLAVVA